MPAPEAVLAVDIGGTKTAVALVDATGALLERAAAPTPAADGPEAVVAGVAALASELVARADARVLAIGVGTAGVVDVDRGAIISATDTFARWAGTPLADELRAALAPLVGAVPVVVRNDVDAHALGELRAGAAAGASSALLVAVGTGIGAAVIADGRVLRGARHVAGELAHLPIAGADHLRCPCGRPGHLEAIGSGLGIVRQHIALGGDAELDAGAIVALGASGDGLDAQRARRALGDSAAAVGRAIAGAVTLLDPERVVLTGGVLAAGEAWWAPMERALRAELVDVLQDVPLVRGELGDAAPLVGAAWTAWQTVEGAA